MSKFTRGQLKDLVKECLVEILSEGLASRSNASDSAIVESRTSRPRGPGAPIPPRSASSALNSVIFGSTSADRPPAARPSRRDRQETRPPPASAAESIVGLTSDPIMAQIFADTAATTLQEQVQADSGRPGSASGSELIGEPGDLFEGARNWAALAFSDPVKRN